MKKFILAAFICFSTISNAQVFTGKGDKKFQVGANIQENGKGIFLSSDFGMGENMSWGISANYLLSTVNIAGDNANFDDKLDVRARFNANIANVFGAEEKLDVYPGLDLGLRNFGGHLGIRYFFTNGFGVFSELAVPIAKYNNSPIGFENYNNQFNFTVGASFNLQ